jgi:hypothetical protein
MKIAVVAIAIVAATLVGRRIISRSPRPAVIDREIAAKTKAYVTAIDQAAAAIGDMMADGLYEDKSVAEIEKDFHGLVVLYNAQ